MDDTTQEPKRFRPLIDAGKAEVLEEIAADADGIYPPQFDDDMPTVERFMGTDGRVMRVVAVDGRLFKVAVPEADAEQ